MQKRIVVAGCRDFCDYPRAKAYLETLLAEWQPEEPPILLSGKCRGADALGERFAREKGWQIEFHPANWDLHGRAAGPIRNKEMVDVCDIVVCFWDGQSRGTASLIRYAKAAGRELYIHYI